MSAVLEPVALTPRREPTPVELHPFAPPPALQVESPAAGKRNAFLEFLRAASAHLIVWHHLVFFGPLSDEAAVLFPRISDFFFDHVRYAVQVFFVIGGFVAGTSLAKARQFSARDVARNVGKRYWRIGGPYLCLLPIAIAANAFAGWWMDHDSISAFPTLPQFFSHAAFLQEVLGYEPLTAGIWYLAIDFQLGIALAALFWLSHRLAARWQLSPLVVAQFFVWPLAVASLWWFNQHDAWEDWWIYFFGSYAFGLIAAWAVSGRLPKWTFWLFAAVIVVALGVEFRWRLTVTLAAGAAVFAAGCLNWLSRWPTNRWLLFAAATSYSLFLVHFPVCLVTNAILSNYVLHSPWLCLAGMFAAYGLSLAAAVAFYYGVDRRFHADAGVAHGR